jgi:hypothetical protein
MPAQPNIEYLRKLAKDRLDELRRADATARLSDAHLDMACEHGFASWRRLHEHVTALEPTAEPARETSRRSRCWWRWARTRAGRARRARHHWIWLGSGRIARDASR